MAQEGGEHDKRVASSPYVSSVDRQSSGGSYGDRPPKRSEVASGAGVTAAAAAVAGVAPVGGTGGSNDRLLMKRTLVAQSKKIQQLAAKIDVMETERGAMRQQASALQMAVFEASTRAEQTAEQYKRDAVEAAVREIAQDREAFAEGRREALKRIEELEDALEIALNAAGGVHRQLLELGLSCEDLGKTSVHLSVQAQEAPVEDKPALAVAGDTIEAVVGVMRAMERSGVFDLLDPVGDEEEEEEEEEAVEQEAGEGGGGAEESRSPFVLTVAAAPASSGAPLTGATVVAGTAVEAGGGGGGGGGIRCDGSNTAVPAGTTAAQSFCSAGVAASAAVPPLPPHSGVASGCAVPASTTRETDAAQTKDVDGSIEVPESSVSMLGSSAVGTGRAREVATKAVAPPPATTTAAATAAAATTPSSTTASAAAAAAAAAALAHTEGAEEEEALPQGREDRHQQRDGRGKLTAAATVVEANGGTDIEREPSSSPSSSLSMGRGVNLNNGTIQQSSALRERGDDDGPGHQVDDQGADNTGIAVAIVKAVAEREGREAAAADTGGAAATAGDRDAAGFRRDARGVIDPGEGRMRGGMVVREREDSSQHRPVD